MVIYEDQAVTSICTYICISKMCGCRFYLVQGTNLVHVAHLVVIICLATLWNIYWSSVHMHTQNMYVCAYTHAHTHTHTIYAHTHTQVTVTHSGLLCHLVLVFVSFLFFFRYKTSYWIIMWVSVMISVSLTSWRFVSTTFQLGSSRLLSKQDLSNCIMRAFIVLSKLGAFILILVTTAWFQGHSGIRLLKLKVVFCWYCSFVTPSHKEKLAECSC